MTEWQCEQCGSKASGEPASSETHPGYKGERVELYFCEDCTDE